MVNVTEINIWKMKSNILIKKTLIYLYVRLVFKHLALYTTPNYEYCIQIDT